MACKGVDLTHPQWLLARANVEGTWLKAPDSVDASGWPAEMILDRERAFWKEIERRLAIESLGADIPDVQEKVIRPVFEAERTFIDRKVFGNESKDELWLAVAFPYATPPSARRCLHNLFSPQNIPFNLRQRRSAVEAPVALAVEAVARGAVALDSPAHLLLLTGGPPSLELTAATLGRLDGTLRIEITGSSAVDPADFAGSLGRLGDRDPRGRLVHAGIADEAAKVAAASGRDPGADGVLDLGRQAIAIGAVRFGGLLMKQFWVGNQVRKVEVERSAPLATGVLGTNGRGEWFWRRVVEQGARLGTDPVMTGLCAGTSVPDRVALADCPRPEFAARRWLHQQDWAAAGLRWHDVVPNPQKPGDWDLQFKVSTTLPQWNRLSNLLWEVVPTTKGTSSGALKAPNPTESR